MTPSESRARTLLATNPLVFGNPEQIEAAEFLGAMANCRAFLDAVSKSGCDLNEKCSCCRGRGYTRCSECDAEHECHGCDGYGKIEIDCDDCVTSAQAKALLVELRQKYPDVAL